jgi:hypothetical protein
MPGHFQQQSATSPSFLSFTLPFHPPTHPSFAEKFKYDVISSSLLESTLCVRTPHSHANTREEVAHRKRGTLDSESVTEDSRASSPHIVTPTQQLPLILVISIIVGTLSIAYYHNKYPLALALVFTLIFGGSLYLHLYSSSLRGTGEVGDDISRSVSPPFCLFLTHSLGVKKDTGGSNRLDISGG